MKNTPYTAIDCNNYDILLANATLRKKCSIVYIDEDENKVKIEAIIVDVYTKAKEEFMLLDNAAIIRLDKIISVDDISITRS